MLFRSHSASGSTCQKYERRISSRRAVLDVRRKRGGRDPLSVFEMTDSHFQIKVNRLEFYSYGNTVWIQGINGTVLRIKTLGRIKLKDGCENICAHGDIITPDDIEICIP